MLRGCTASKQSAAGYDEQGMHVHRCTTSKQSDAGYDEEEMHVHRCTTSKQSRVPPPSKQCTSTLAPGAVRAAVMNSDAAAKCAPMSSVATSLAGGSLRTST